MGTPLPVLSAFEGFMRDIPRSQLPAGVMWDMVDWIPGLDGSARKRFGIAPAGGVGTASDFNTIHAVSLNFGTFCAYVPFASGHEVVAATESNELFRYTEPTYAGSYVASLGGAKTQARPVFHREKLVIVDQSRECVFYTGGGVAPTVGVGTPHGKCATLWGDYTVVAGTSAQPQRVYFSAAGDPTTYDLTNSWIDIPGAVVGVQGIRGALLVWTDREVWRVRGDTPPSNGIIGNLVRDKLADTGLVDERSIATYGDTVIYANAEGIWATAGAAPVDLTESGGIGTFWRQIIGQLSTWGPSGYTIAAGIYRGYYVISVLSAQANVKTTLLCNLSSRRWIRFSGDTIGSMFAHNLSNTEELFFTSLLNGYVATLSSAWGNLTASPATDFVTGTFVPSIETPMFKGWQRFHRRWVPSNATSVWQRVYLFYYGKLGNGLLSGAPISVGYTTTPNPAAFQESVQLPFTPPGYTLLSGSLPYVNAETRGRLAINAGNGGAVPAREIGFRIYQTANNACDVWLNSLELEYFTREGSR